MNKPIIITNKRNSAIKGVLYKASGQPLIIACNGFNDEYTNPIIRKLVQSIHNENISVFTFNYAIDSSGINIKNQVEDIEAILSYFKDYSKKILMGGSLGALGAAIAAKRHPNLAGLITINGFFNLKHLSMPLFIRFITFQIASLISKKHQLLNSFITSELVPKLIQIPTLLIHGRKDKSVFYTQSEIFYKKLGGNKTLKLLEDVDHCLTTKNCIEQISKIIIEWLQLIQESNGLKRIHAL